MPKMSKREPNRESGSDNSTILHKALKGAIQGAGLDLPSLFQNAGVEPEVIIRAPLYAAILAHDLGAAVREFESLTAHQKDETYNHLLDHFEFLDVLLERLENS